MNPSDLPFPIIQLPAVPRRFIFRLIDSGDLLDLSLCSKRMTQMIKETRTEAKRHTISMQTNATSHQIEFVNEKRILIWDFMSGYDRDELTEQRIVGSETFEESLKVRQVDVGLDSFNVFYGADYQKGICEVSKHLCHIFPGPIELHTSVAFGNFTEIFSYPHLHHLDRIHIAGSILLKKTLEQIFGKTTVKTEISIDPDTDDEYPIMQSLDVEHLDLGDGRWVKREHLVKLTCRTVHFHQHFLKYKDIEEFAKTWLSTPNTRMERLSLVWMGEWDETKLDGVNGHKWIPSQRERNYFVNTRGFNRIDCTHGLDIERESDGELATFVWQENNLWFLVWKERRPEKKRLEGLKEKLKPIYDELERLINEYPDSCSLERLLSNRNLSCKEFVDTYKVLRGMDGEIRLSSTGRACRRVCFDKIFRLIDWNDDFEFL